MPVNSGLDPQLKFLLVKVSNVSFNAFCAGKILSSTLLPYFSFGPIIFSASFLQPLMHSAELIKLEQIFSRKT